jgi:hypothetical protein
VPFWGDYIQMSIFPRTLKWESQNWYFCCFKTFNVYIFFQIKFVLKKWGQYFIATKKSFSMVYNILQSNLIWPLLSKDLWSEVKFSIWFPHLLLIIIMQINSKWTMQGHFKHLCLKTFLMLSWGLIWCLFALPTKVSNICNSHMSATPKVGMQLRVIRL